MVRISKLTDYAVVIMAYIAGVSISNPEYILQAREIAQDTHLALPTVSKLLKTLTKHKFLNSLRGVKGGYQLTIAPEQVSIVDLIQALEGPLAITECNLGHQHCLSETQCAIRTPWLHINQIITNTLSAVKLSDLVNIQGIEDGFNTDLNNNPNTSFRAKKDSIPSIPIKVILTDPSPSWRTA